MSDKKKVLTPADIKPVSAPETMDVSKTDERGSVNPVPFKIRNRIEEKLAKAAQEAGKAARRLEALQNDEDGSVEAIGVWRNPEAMRKLGLDKLPKDTELVLDIIPDHPKYGGGVSTNGVPFPAGSLQLLPANMWADIKGRISKRWTNEENFYHPGKVDQTGEKIGHYADNS